MKKAFFIISIIFISCNSNLKYLNQFDGFNGKPKKIEAITYKVEHKDSIATEEMAYKLIEFYDFKGKKNKTLMFKSDGSPSTGGIYYSYDKYGNEIKSIMYNRDSTINSKSNYKYNKFGQQIENILFWGDKIKSITQSNFDRDNRVEEIIGKNGDGSFKEYAIQKFDKKWNKTELISYDSIGNQEVRIEFGYDENHNLNTYKWYNAKNELYNLSKTTFNKQNDPIIVLGYIIQDKDTILNQTTKFEYKYDEKKNVMEKKLFSDDKFVWITKYYYEY